MIKRIHALFISLVTVLSVFALASCGLVADKRYRGLEEVCNAESVTISMDSTVYKVDKKNMILYTSAENYDGYDAYEIYMYYDKDDDAYYTASVTDLGGENSVFKQEITRAQFIETFTSCTKHIDIYLTTYLSTIDMWGKQDNGYVLADEDGSKVTIKIEDDGLVLMAGEGTLSDRIRFYDVDKTKIKIPQSVINEVAERLNSDGIY